MLQYKKLFILNQKLFFSRPTKLFMHFKAAPITQFKIKEKTFNIYAFGFFHKSKVDGNIVTIPPSHRVNKVKR